MQAGLACATTDPVLGPIRVDLNATRPFQTSAHGPVVSGLFSVGDDWPWMSYDASYVVQRGEVLKQLVDDDVQAPSTAALSSIGTQAIGQTFSLKLPQVDGAPIALDFRQSQTSQWSLNGDRLTEERVAALGWNPQPLGVSLRWSAPRAVIDVLSPLDCQLSGTISFGTMPSTAAGQAVQISGRECNAVAPMRGVDGADVNSWAGSWLWGAPKRQQRVSLAMFESEDPSLAADGGGYELSLSQVRTAGRWIGDAGLGVRRADRSAVDYEQTDWTAHASIQRRLDDISLTASWQRAADPLWFLPTVAAPADQYSVGFNLRPWMQRVWQRSDVSSALTYQLVRPYMAEAAANSLLQWSLTVRW